MAENEAIEPGAVCSQCNGYGVVSDMDYTGRETLYDCDLCNGTGESQPDA